MRVDHAILQSSVYKVFTFFWRQSLITIYACQFAVCVLHNKNLIKSHNHKMITCSNTVHIYTCS